MTLEATLFFVFQGRTVSPPSLPDISSNSQDRKGLQGKTVAFQGDYLDSYDELTQYTINM